MTTILQQQPSVTTTATAATVTSIMNGTTATDDNHNDYFGTTNNNNNTAATMNDDTKEVSSTTTTTTTLTLEETKLQQQQLQKKEEQGKDDEEENQLKYVNWPYRDIKEPHPNDVLYGRGGGTNHHLGNKRFRKMVEDRKIDYVNCKRLDKPLVALGIIREWRGQTPMGRFLKMDDKTGLWNDVGDRKAREKTSQALREKAPQIREELEKDRIARERRERGESTEEEEEEEGEEEDDTPIKSTRFANGTNTVRPGKPAVVARDHSLGREYIDPDDNMSVEGFSWQDPVARGNSDSLLERVGSHGSSSGYPPPPFAGLPGSRMGSYSSIGPPPPPGVGPYDQTMPPPPHDMHARYASWNRYESWGSVGQHHHHHHPPPPQMGYGPYPVQSGGWTSRDHSLGAIPLQHANISQAAYPATFDHRMGSSGPYWGPQPPHGHGHHPHYPPPMEGGPPYPMSGVGYPPPQYSGGPPPPSSRGPPPSYIQPPPATKPHPNYYKTSAVVPPPVSPKSPTYSVDPVVASQWSGRDQNEIQLTMSGSSCEEQADTFVSPPINSTTSSKARTSKSMNQLKPDMIKRATSNQNETTDTKPDFDGKCVKRAALNRDSSQAANALKAKYMPGYFDPKAEVELLSSNLEQSTLDPTLPPKPAQITNQDRLMTLDMAALDLVIKPTMLRMTSRSTTIDALNIDFDDDNIDYSKTDPFAMSSPAITEFDRDLSNMEDIFNESRVLSRPNALRSSQRLTTCDLIDIVNEPLSDNDD